jgi:preprotein translocase subunit SecG
MLFLIILLSVVMVIDCIIMVFLVLMQLPKKEAGAGLAFGGAATDALFGAGSGNFLTKATKYTAGAFFALAILLSILQSHRAHQAGSEFMERVKLHQNEQPSISAPPTPPAQSTVAPSTNLLVIPSTDSAPATVSTNATTIVPAPQK